MFHQIDRRIFFTDDDDEDVGGGGGGDPSPDEFNLFRIWIKRGEKIEKIFFSIKIFCFKRKKEKKKMISITHSQCIERQKMIVICWEEKKVDSEKKDFRFALSLHLIILI